jgi:hypothetical protein
MVSPSGEVAAGVLLNKRLDTGQGLHPLPLDRGSALVREALRASLKAKKSGAGGVWRDMNSDPDPAPRLMSSSYLAPR